MQYVGLVSCVKDIVFKENGMISGIDCVLRASGRTCLRFNIAAVMVAGAMLALAGCGGGGGDGNRGGFTPPPASSNYTPGVFAPSANLKSQCSSAALQNDWLRSWTNESYLWYSEVPDLNPASYTTPNYFDLLKTSATTSSGSDKDKFHFTYSTAEWEALSQSGITAGYGAQFVILEQSPPREVVVAYVEPGSPAAAAGIGRGDRVLAIDGADAVNGNTQAIINVLNAGLFPASANETHQITLRDNANVTATVTLQSANVTLVPVQNVAAIAADAGPVGYMLFNDHIATAEAALIDAINTLKAANVTDLVLDIRYNGGGYLDIASELAYMIAGPTRTIGLTFENVTFNDKYTTTNPVTGAPLAPTPFHSTTRFASGTPQALPTLNLGRVYVLTGSGTCSASESIMNGLRGVNVEVIQIGGTTCGKPYGFYPAGNCGTTYFSIQFKGVNAAGFGDYTDGFSPANTLVAPAETIPGCSVRDDFSRELGDTTEARLAAALSYRTSGTCPAAPTGPVAQAKSRHSTAPVEGIMVKSPLRENRILREP
jgi:carboxyl-terminal processing protease